MRYALSFVFVDELLAHIVSVCVETCVVCTMHMWQDAFRIHLHFAHALNVSFDFLVIFVDETSIAFFVFLPLLFIYLFVVEHIFGNETDWI